MNNILSLEFHCYTVHYFKQCSVKSCITLLSAYTVNASATVWLIKNEKKMGDRGSLICKAIDFLKQIFWYISSDLFSGGRGVHFCCESFTKAKLSTKVTPLAGLTYMYFASFSMQSSYILSDMPFTAICRLPEMVCGWM